MDPAGAAIDDKGLNRTCAQFVQVLHSEISFFGTPTPLGHSDFYANFWNEFAPGCPFAECGHIKVVFYYFSSLFGDHKFIGESCDEISTNSTSVSRFGVYGDDKIGRFCFNTSACYPYCI